MKKRDFIDHHIVEAVLSSLAEAHGDEVLSRHLRAKTKLRLVTMSEKERWALADRMAHPPARPVELVYRQINESVEQWKTDCCPWIEDLEKTFLEDE